MSAKQSTCHESQQTVEIHHYLIYQIMRGKIHSEIPAYQKHRAIIEEHRNRQHPPCAPMLNALENQATRYRQQHIRKLKPCLHGCPMRQRFGLITEIKRSKSSLLYIYYRFKIPTANVKTLEKSPFLTAYLFTLAKS